LEQRRGDIFPDARYGFEPALDVYELHRPGDGGPARWHAAYSQNALAESIRAPRHEQSRRNPELHAQMDVMAQSLDRVQEQALALQRATGRIPGQDVRTKADLELELQALSSQVDGLSLTVGALVQSLVGLGASSFNWSEGLGTPRRKSLAELVLAYTQPCSHIDPRLQDLCADLSVELAKERLDDIPVKPWDVISNHRNGRSPSRDGRSPPPGGPQPASPQKSKFQVKGAVQGSLKAWKDLDQTSGGQTTGTQFFEELQGKAPSRLKITILHAQGLRKEGATSDPYCTCEVPGKKGTKVQTKTVKNTQTPTWNHAFFCEHAKGDSLRFTVWDDERRDKVLGLVTLTESEFYPRGFHGELDLEKGGYLSKDPKLKVKIEVVEEGLESREPQPELSPIR